MKLTIALRKEILKNVLDHAFSAQENQLAEQQGELATEAYNEAYTEEERAFMDKVGRSGFYSDSSIYVNIGGRHSIRLIFGGQAKFRMPAREAKIASDSLKDKIKKHTKAAEALRDLRLSAGTSAEGILNSVSTVKRLIEVWPEVAAFIPKEPAKIGNLPMVQMQQLNNTLGLPPETQE